MWVSSAALFFAVSVTGLAFAAPAPGNTIDRCNWGHTTEMSDSDQGKTPRSEKESRTPEQKKIDSQLLYAIYQMRGEAAAKGVPTEPIQLRKDHKGRVFVDVTAKVSKKLLSRIEKLGGKIVYSSERYNSITAYIPLKELESLAHSSDVKFIMPHAEAMHN
jgi:hypothetical protein